jgi:hypothetical protein
MHDILSNLDIIDEVSPKLREIIVEAYSNSLIHVWSKLTMPFKLIQ